jgi:hypothetical protein
MHKYAMTLRCSLLSHNCDLHSVQIMFNYFQVNQQLYLNLYLYFHLPAFSGAYKYIIFYSESFIFYQFFQKSYSMKYKYLLYFFYRLYFSIMHG